MGLVSQANGEIEQLQSENSILEQKLKLMHTNQFRKQKSLVPSLRPSKSVDYGTQNDFTIVTSYTIS